MIDNFRGKYLFLSNFYEAPVDYDGLTYRNNEAAFQSAKLCNKSQRIHIVFFGTEYDFTKIDPSTAKYLGRRVFLRQDWNSIEDNVMYQIVKSKFSQNEDLKNKLLETGDEELIEGNTWKDRYWGVCNGKGENHLGKILMRVRSELK